MTPLMGSKTKILVGILILGFMIGVIVFDFVNEDEKLVEALQITEDLEKNHLKWYDVLPDCPCTASEARNSSIWIEDDLFAKLFILPKYHPGADTGFRSELAYSSIEGTSHGQQCTYDKNGKLITEGPGAGTPDFWSPITNFSEHQTIDVVPWETLGWEKYNQHWVPNDGVSCTTNKK